MKSVSCSMNILVFFEYSNSIRGLRGGWKRGARTSWPGDRAHTPLFPGGKQGAPGGVGPRWPCISTKIRAGTVSAAGPRPPVIRLTCQTSAYQGEPHLDTKGLILWGCKIGACFALP